VELQERTQRWKNIEKICGFNIVTNPGIPYLNSLLCRSSHSLMSGQCYLLLLLYCSLTNPLMLTVAIKYPVPDRVNLSFVIFDFRAL